MSCSARPRNKTQGAALPRWHLGNIVLHFSPGGAADSSPRRKPWESVQQKFKPRRGDRSVLTAAISFAPPGLASWIGPDSHGLRRGLLSVAPPGLNSTAHLGSPAPTPSRQNLLAPPGPARRSGESRGRRGGTSAVRGPGPAGAGSWRGSRGRGRGSRRRAMPYSSVAPWTMPPLTPPPASQEEKAW